MALVSAQAERARWNERYAAGSGPTRVNERLARHLHLLKRGRALDLAGGIGQNDALLAEWRVILVDLSDEALARGTGMRVQADGLALPFAPGTFDTIVDTYYYEPSLDLAALLIPGGTLFFETYTLADRRYRPEFCHAPRLDPAAVAEVFKGLDILYFEETDTGERVFATLVGRKPAVADG